MDRLFSIIVFAIMMAGLLAAPVVSADDKSCWLEATNSDIYLAVYDLDRDGNELAKVWEGVLTQGNKKRLMSTDGRIRYYTNISGHASSAGVEKMCQNAETISLP